jgi:putative ABC transport system permease protein
VQCIRELAIRIALGASRGDVLSTIVGESLRYVLTGVIVGVAALAASCLLGSFLFGVRSFDPVTCAALTIVSLRLQRLICLRVQQPQLIRCLR